MTEAEFQRVLKEALEERYADIPDPDELEYDYTFSPRFERRMKRMIRNFDRIRSKAQREAARAEAAQQNNRRRGHADSGSVQYVTFGRHTMRRAVAIALVATLILALAACAIRFAIIWHETNNEKQGTLDVTFELEDPTGAYKEFQYMKPMTPSGFEIVNEYQENQVYNIEYRSIADEKQIIYSQSGGVENAGISIDNDDDSFKKIKMNNYDGYCIAEEDYSFIGWSDGISFFAITSNTAFETILELAESLY
ncbi:MAG: DUF4367 domain-containing protein [Clostridia bacterium]